MFALSALCDQGPYGASCIFMVLPEVVWGDNGWEFQLTDTFPPEGTYEMVIVSGRPHRRAWAQIAVEGFLSDAASFVQY